MTPAADYPRGANSVFRVPPPILGECLARNHPGAKRHTTEYVVTMRMYYRGTLVTIICETVICDMLTSTSSAGSSRAAAHTTVVASR